MNACKVEKPEETFLVIDSQSVDGEQIQKLLEGWGFTVAYFTDIGAGLNWFAESEPLFVVVNADMPGGGQLISDIRSFSTEASLIVVAQASRLLDTMRSHRYTADEFVAKPVEQVALEIAVQRARKIKQLSRALKQTCGHDRNFHTCENVAREVANERFLVVRQIIEKMSAFIAQIASGVEGGVRYFNELPYFVSVHNASCSVLAANATSLKYLGNRLYQNSWAIFAGKRATRRNCPVGRTIRSGNVETTKALVRYASGAKVPVLVHTAPVYDNEGEVVLVLEVFAGTQEIDQLAARIRTTQQRYAQLFDAVPDQVVVLDRRLNITAANSRFKNLFGDHAGRKFFDIFTPAAFPAHRDPISLSVSDGLAHHGEMVLTGPDHRQYTMMTRTSPILTASGKMMQVLAIMTDITEYRQIKDHMAALGLMLSTVCHDMKGCLTGLDAGLYHIDRGFYRNMPGRIEEGIEVIRLMTDRLRKLALDVLYSAKERDLELETLDVLTFAGDIVAAIEARIKGANIAFNWDFSLCAGRIQIDIGLMRTAIINILENAVEACLSHNRDRPHSIAFIVLSKADHIVMDIQDTGKGIAREEIKQIFDIFHSSKGRRGTGLGLYITEKAVRKHGGWIEVESTPGQGTLFRIHLPRRLPEGSARQ